MTFRILPIDITIAEIGLVKDSYGFTGDAVTADVESITVTRNGVKKYSQISQDLRSHVQTKCRYGYS